MVCERKQPVSAGMTGIICQDEKQEPSAAVFWDVARPRAEPVDDNARVRLSGVFNDANPKCSHDECRRFV